MSSERDQRLLRAEKAVRQGSLELAIAEFAVLVNEDPADLSSANTLGDLLVRAGRVGEALPLYLHVGDSYLREGFFSKAAGFYRKVLKFSPDDEATALRLVEALARQRLVVEAKAQLRLVELARRRRGDGNGADQLVVRAAELDPRDLDARLEAVRVLVRDADPRAPRWLAEAVDACREAGRHADALPLLRELVAFEPDNAHARGDLVEALVASGDAAGALALVGPAQVRAYPALRRRAAELALRHGDLASARAVLANWLAVEPAALETMAALCAPLDAVDPARGYLATEIATDAALARHDYVAAAGLVRQYLAGHPGRLTALLRLVDVCVDGGLDDLLTDAQLQLADAFVAHDRAAEARVVLEDVLLDEPDHVGCRARLAAVLASLGEPDPQAAIDRVLALEDDDDAPEEGLPEPGAAAAPSTTDRAAGRGAEVDLTAALNALALDHAVDVLPLAEPSTPMPARPATLEGVFDRLREEASPRRGTEGRQLVALGHTYLAAGMVEAAIETFRKATLDGEARALAAMALSETYEELEDPARALEWLEHGADAQESPETERLDAMRRLAEALDRGGEPERALAVWLEVATLRPQDPQAASAVTRLSGEQRRS